MLRKSLLLGLSTAAMTVGLAGTASAQTGNTQSGNCTTATGGISAGGTCVVDNNAPGNDDNLAFVSQSGEDNFARITQRGDENVGIIEQQGQRNSSTIRQDGDDHFADSDQRGIDNQSTINQGDDENSATVNQTGDGGNRSFVGQGTVPGSPAGTVDPDAGENNVVTVNQNGTNLASIVNQRRLTAAEVGTVAGSGFEGPADDNSATVTQTGTGSLSNLAQLSRGNVARVQLGGGGLDAGGAGTTQQQGRPIVARNESVVTQYNQFFVTSPTTGQLVSPPRNAGDPVGGPTPTNNPRSDNLADVSIIGIGNGSRVEQNGVLNSASVAMLGGGAGNTGSTTDTSNPNNVGPNGNQLPANRRQGNDSIIFQYGRGNVASVSSGGLGGQGNQSMINQGTFTDFGPGRTEGSLARDHRAFSFQRGILDNLTINQENNLRGPNGAAQGASFADVSQRTLNSTVYLEQRGTNTASVSQGGGVNPGDNSARIRQQDAGDVAGSSGGGIFDDPATANTVARNTAQITQAGIGNTLTVDQDARNATAIVWQQNGSRGNSVEIEQGTGAQGAGGNNALDNGAVGSQGGFLAGDGTDIPLGGTSATVDASDTGFNALRLTADVTQNGRGSRARVRQDGQDLSAVVTQSGTATSGGAPAVSNNFVGVSQINALNSATVNQTGFSLSATVDQRGSGTLGTDGVTRRNLVTIQQTNSNHRAIARQTVDVNPSGPDSSPTGTSPAAGPPAGDPNASAFRFARAAGRQSAEITIIQRGATLATGDPGGNDAFVEQQGDGQFARIEQEGRGNNAGIQQQTGATNAVAVIEQFGNGNSFFITQDSPGQYFQIRQSGNNNSSETIVSSSGPTSVTGGTGTNTPPAFFPFP